MKRLVLIICFALLGTTAMQAQSGLRIGANVGLPVGDIEKVSNFQAGVDLAYMLDVADMLYLGPKIGYTQFFMDEDNFGGF